MGATVNFIGLYRCRLITILTIFYHFQNTTFMKAAEPTSKSADLWQKTHYANLVRYVPSGVYFARMRVKGKLIHKSLTTDTGLAPITWTTYECIRQGCRC